MNKISVNNEYIKYMSTEIDNIYDKERRNLLLGQQNRPNNKYYFLYQEKKIDIKIKQYNTTIQHNTTQDKIWSNHHKMREFAGHQLIR